MTKIIPILTVVSTVISAVGAISQGQAQAASYQTQANAAEYNAKIEEDNAKQAKLEASIEEEAFRRRYRQTRGTQIAAIAQAGIGFEGTGGDLIEQSDINAELDALNIRYEGEMRARQNLQQATLERYQASGARSNAKASKTAGYMTGAATLIGGGATAGEQFIKYGGF